MFRLAFAIADHAGRAVFFRHKLSGLPQKTNALVMLVFSLSAAVTSIKTGLASDFILHTIWLFALEVLFSVPLAMATALVSIALDGLYVGIQHSAYQDYLTIIDLWQVTCLVVLIYRNQVATQATDQKNQ